MEIPIIFTALLCVILALGGSRGIELTAYISQNGLHGEVIFQRHSQKTGSLLVKVSLQPVDEFSKWSWSIREYPVHYNNLENRCQEEKLGPQLLNLDDILGPIILPRNDTDELIIPENVAHLIGNKGLWGRSLLIHQFDYRVRRACGTITVSGAAEEKIAEAKFYSPIAGSVFMRWVGSAFSDSIGALIHTDLYWVAKNNESLEADTLHSWKIYATDIFDAESVKSRDSCNFLQFIFDPTSSAAGETVGDIDTRVGKVKIAIKKDSRVIGNFHDSELTPLPVDVVLGQRSLYLVIFDPKHEDRFLACAKIRHIVPYTYIALMQSEGVSGHVTFSQRSPFDPTTLAFNLSSYEEKFLGKPTYITDFKIHELPPPTSSFDITERNPCYHVGGIYNPSNIDADQASGSQDTYAVGDLNGKHNMLQEDLTMDGLNKKYWDIFLPLQGSFSVAHRSLVLYRKMENYSDSSQMVSLPWICTSLTAYNSVNEQWKVQMMTAEVVFRYPIVGRVIFRQPRHDSHSDTAVIVEYMIHADGTSQNNTEEHRWMIHEFPPGRDFYNWSGRCLSAGNTYNPYKVNFETKNSETPCNVDRSGYCQAGDLTHRHGTLKIAGKKKDRLALSRRLFTDTQLSLSGPGSILGKSLVIYDDFGPKARGERLACSEITAVYRRKAVVKDWFGNGNLTPMKGKIEFYQQTEYDVTDVEIDFEGLSETSAFHIHEAPVDAGLDFPCETSTLNGQWNPYNVTPSHSPTPAIGTTDQYQMGDLSGKVGTLDGLTYFEGVYNDSRLPLFGSYSILGRSVIIHKKERDHSWSCSSIERGYAPSEARELRAIASFHHPLGFAYGYIRMTQLVYNDGTKSDTVIEVNLRHPGKNDRNITRNHNWAIYVNPVGVDASVKILDTRCVAGGYQWNPYYTQLADPLNGDLYREECGPDNPLRCYVGDVSGRLGTIDLGVKRQVFSDVNFPLEGDVSAMGRSIVILNKNRGHERFACANIEPDKDIIKYANIQKPPKFVIAQFIDDVREVMGVPEWMLHVDSRKTKILYSGGCIQFLLHFKGPAANQLEQDFSKLLNTGKLSSPSLYIPGYVTPLKRKTQLPYRQCGSSDPRDKKGSRNGSAAVIASPIMVVAMFYVNIYFIN